MPNANESIQATRATLRSTSRRTLVRVPDADALHARAPRAIVASGLIVLVAATTACSAPPSDAAVQENETLSAGGPAKGSSEQGLIQDDWKSGHTLDIAGVGSNSLHLASASTHFCVLTRFAGRFDGYGEWMEAYEWQGEWYLGGNSATSSGVYGQAFCFDKSKFITNGDARWQSGRIEGFLQTAYPCVGLLHAREAWWGDAVTFLSGEHGGLDGSGEWGRVIQAPEGSSPSWLSIGTCREDDGNAWFGYSFFAGTPGSNVAAKFDRSEYAPGQGGSAYMAEADTAMCGFTFLAGAFKGGGDYAQIAPEASGGGTTRWVLRTSGNITARAQCYLRKQN